MSTTTRTFPIDLKPGDVIIEQGEAVEVVSVPRLRAGLVDIDLVGPGNTYTYAPTETVAKIED